jgi:hypothetical protein
MQKNKRKISKKNWKSKLARYFHTGGYGRLAGGFHPPESKVNSLRFKRVYLACGIIFFIIGLLFVIF